MAVDKLTFEIKRNDTAPGVLLTIKNSDGTAFDLTGYTLPRFAMRLTKAGADDTPKVDAVASIVVPATLGQFLYEWAAPDTDSDGVYQGEFEALEPSGRKRTFPKGRNLTIIVNPDLNNG